MWAFSDVVVKFPMKLKSLYRFLIPFFFVAIGRAE